MLLPDNRLEPHHISTQRVIVLSPHLLEWVADLGALEQVVAVIDGADYPFKVKDIPKLGSHGLMSADRILRHDPTLILAWEGGNRPELMAALRRSNVPIVAVKSLDINAIPAEMLRVAEALQLKQAGYDIADAFTRRIQSIRKKYQHASLVPVFYEMSHQPMMTLSNRGVLGQALELCHAQNIFNDVGLAYFQVGMKQVLEHQPKVVIQPVHNATPLYDWSHDVPQISVLRIDADLLHRPTMRLLDGLSQLCQGLEAAR